MNTLMPIWLFKLNVQLVYVLLIAVTLTACPKKVPSYDPASGACETGLGTIAKARDEANCELLQKVENASNDVWTDAGLTTQRYMKDVIIAVHPDSNGTSWSNPDYDGGAGQFKYLHGNSAEACIQRIGERRTMWLANDDWLKGPYCHEGVHILRACVPGMLEHLCLKQQLPDGGFETICTGWFIDNNIDGKCAEAMKGIAP